MKNEGSFQFGNQKAKVLIVLVSALVLLLAAFAWVLSSSRFSADVSQPLTVNTLNPENATASSVKLNGYYKNNANRYVISKTFVYWTTGTNETTVQATATARNNMEFNLTASLSNLQPGKNYQFKACVSHRQSIGKNTATVNTCGTTLGFSTFTKPILSAVTVTAESNQANVRSMVTNNGFGKIRKAGFQYANNTSAFNSNAYKTVISCDYSIPSINSCPMTNQEFKAMITGLEQSQKYVVRAFVESEGGNSYSANKEFTTIAGIDDISLEVDTTSSRSIYAKGIVVNREITYNNINDSGFEYTTASTFANAPRVSTGRPTGNTLEFKTDSIPATPGMTYNVRAYVNVKVTSSTGLSSQKTYYSKTKTVTMRSDPVPTAYSITASTGIGGTVSPAGTQKVNAGQSKIYTITPKQGYKIKDVLVNGKSVGARTSYNFSNVTSNQTISATFYR